MDKQRGFLVMVVALLLVVITAFATAFVAMTISGSRASIGTIHSGNAYALAKSGLEAGSYQLSQATAWCNGSWSATVPVTGQGEYKYLCTSNTASTTLASAMSPNSTAPITFNTPVTGTLATFGAITIDSETIYYDGISGNTLQNIRRGQNGTSGNVTHNVNAPITQSQYMITAQGGAPSLNSSHGNVMLYQALLAPTTGGSAYFVAGSNGTNGVILKYDGTNWSTVLTVGAGFMFNSLNTSSTYGEAAGTISSTSSIYTFNGSTWSATPKASGINDWLYDIACDIPSNPTTCWAGGQRQSPNPRMPNVYASATGNDYYAGANNASMQGISCNSGWCMAISSSTSGANAWIFSSPSYAGLNDARRAVTNPMQDVSCPAARICAVVGGSAQRVYFYNNGTWSQTAALGYTLNTINCPDANTCFVGGNFGRLYKCTFTGGWPWSCVQQTSPDTTVAQVRKMYCKSNTDCLAVLSNNNKVFRYSGATWSNLALPASTYNLMGVGGTSGSAGPTAITPTVFRNQP